MNPDAPIGIVEALAEDGNPLVGYVAAGLLASRSAVGGGATAGLATLDKAEVCHDRVRLKTVSGDQPRE